RRRSGGALAAGLAALFVELRLGPHGRLRDGRRALDALVVVGEADDQAVRHLGRADPRSVADAGPAVDQDVVVALGGLRLEGLEERAAAETIVEVLPVEGTHLHGVGVALTPRGEEVDPAALRKVLEVDGEDVLREIRVLEVPARIRGRLRIDGA